MSLWVLDKEAMASFVTNTMADYRVVGPVAKGTKFAFDRIEDPADLRLDYDTSILPPKKYLQPQEERMMTFTRTGEPVVELDIDAPPTVVLGVHTCDLHGMRVLDEAFSQGYPDASYLERRKKTLLVGIECLEPCDEHSFCKSMGTLTASEGYDLHLTDLGDSYAVDVGSSTGRTLLQKNSDARQATEADMQRINRVLGAKWPRFPYKLEFDVAELSTLMAQSYENPRRWICRRNVSTLRAVISAGCRPSLTAARSAGSPKASQPIGCSTASPFMRWKREMTSLGT